MVLDQEGDVRNKTTVNTYTDKMAAKVLTSFIRDIPDNSYVIIATQGSTFDYTTGAEDALKSLGARDPILPPRRGSWAFVGFKGTKKPNIIRQASDSKLSSVIKLEIFLYN